MGKRGLTELVIPEGPYCYRPLGPMAVPPEGGLPRMPIKLCPYWHSERRADGSIDERGAYCQYMDEYDPIILWDQVKICGVNDEWDIEDTIDG